MAKKIYLTAAKKKLIIDNVEAINDLNELTKLVWDNPELDGRSIQGRLVRQFLVENSVDFKTTRPIKREELKPLSKEDQEFIITSARAGESCRDIARTLFKNDKLQIMSKEWRAVNKFIAETDDALLKEDDKDVATDEYSAPKELVKLVKTVNGALGTEISAANISGKYKAYFDKLSINLDNSRLKRIINSYQSYKDRCLFVDEFIRLTFEKPDLTPDEINLYMQVCRDAVSLEVLEANINKLNDMFSDAEEAADLKHTFSENMKTFVSEKNEVTKRIASNTQKLQGDRAKRINSEKRDDVTILTLINLAKDEKERENMLRLAEMQRLAITEEANRFESLDSWVCRVMGVSKEEVI